MPVKFKKPAGRKVLKLKTQFQGSGRSKEENIQEEVTNKIRTLHIRESSRQILPEKVYFGELMKSKRYFALSKHNYFAVADCESNGVLNFKYCIIEKTYFYDDLNRQPLLLCSCEEASVNFRRLKSLNKNVRLENLKDFIKREEDRYCIHLKNFKNIQRFNPVVTEETSSEKETENFEEDSVAEEDEIYIDQLSVSPILVAVYVEDDGYGLIRQEKASGKARFRCLSCKSNIYGCEHVISYKLWNRKRNVDMEAELNLQDNEDDIQPYDFPSVSFKKIPYPLPQCMRKVFDEYESNIRQFPTHFVPQEDTGTCKHGFKWDNRDPIEMHWIESTKVLLHLPNLTINADDGKPKFIYYRPSTSSCGCKLYYDGQDDLFFNLDNKNLIYYGLLFQYLHAMVQAGTPLASMHRYCTDTNIALSDKDIVSLKILRKAWNAFARLLDISWQDSFSCNECQTNPRIVICDATDIGIRKDFLPNISDQTASSSGSGKTVKGSAHKDRVFIKNTTTRKLLLKLVGERQGFRKRNKKLNIKSILLTKKEIHQLKKCLADETNGSSLSEMVNEIEYLGYVPEHYRILLSELGRNTPVCGIFQTNGNEESLALVKNIIETGNNIRQTIHSDKYDILQNTYPILASFLTGCPDILPHFISDLLQDIVKIMERTLNIPESDKSFYSVVTDDVLDFFPVLTKRHGNALYNADRNKPSESRDNCRKESWGHPTLSPGIFTIYCNHGVCYGFSIMDCNESPRQPFNLFKQRFATAPEVIVYDNACKLHAYCLNREPKFFKNSLFVVDRFHWKGHTACSSGYNLSMYTSMNLKAINSQVNEQGNAGIQRLKGHLSYMHFENFTFHLKLYYAMKNRGKC